MADALEGLNEAQREAVTSTEGYVRVIAGAGSGKTRALSHRFAYLVNELGILPGHILCVTFTNKSANEMRQRIHLLTGDNDTGYINTFHGFCVSVLQEDSHAVQYPKSFLVIDNSDIDAMLKIIYEERGLTLRDMTFSAARDMFEMRKIFREPDYYLDMITMPLEVLKEKYDKAVKTEDILFYGYLYQEKKCFALDYNDLIIFTLYIFEQSESIRLKWQERLEYIMIDEFQDIDELQYRLMKVLCAYHRNLFVVGDPDQTIYTWRGANVKYLLEFDQHFPGTKTILMMENYRSSPEILSAANSLISANEIRMKKDLIPTRPPASFPNGMPVGKPLCHFAPTQEKEAEWIVSQIRQLHEVGVAYRDMMVLYRAHYVSRSIEEALLGQEIPYTIYSGVPFFGRMEIKDALCYLRMIAYKDDLSFARIANVPKRNLGVRRMKALNEYAAARHLSLYESLKQLTDQDGGRTSLHAIASADPLYKDMAPLFKGTGARKFIDLIESYAASYADRSVSEVLAGILNDSGYEVMLRTEGSQERLDNLAELKQSVYEFETSCGEESTLEEYLAHVALYTNSDMTGLGEKVKLMTVHTAKGLEFPYVFLCGMNEGIFPSRKTRTRQAMEEERRLAYVAVTRAENGLYLTEAAGRNFDGSPRYPSRFLLDIQEDLIDFTEKPQDQLIRDAKAYIAHSSRWLETDHERRLFPAGQRIRHAVFGLGTITGIDEDKSAYLIQFDEISTVRAISFKVRLEPASDGER